VAPHVADIKNKTTGVRAPGKAHLEEKKNERVRERAREREKER